MLVIHIITIFPNVFDSFFSESIIGRAQKKDIIKIYTHDLRNYTVDNHKTVDRRPFGGGAGMIMMIEPIYKCLNDIRDKFKLDKGNSKILLTSAKGTLFTQQKAIEFANIENIIIICGHYEGVDHRVAQYLIDEEISIGNYVLSGGETATMVIVDAITRLIPGSLGNPDSLKNESHNIVGEGEYPQYTRPEIFQTEEYGDLKVPEILLSGNHQEVEKWRKKNTSN